MPKDQGRLIVLWAHPRSRSTAFYRMMQNRGDFLTVHEPFCTLADKGSTKLPNGSGGSIVVSNEDELIQSLLQLANDQPVFLKETCDHRYKAETDMNFLSNSEHLFIVREPRRTIASHYAMNPDVKCGDIGYENLFRIFASVRKVQQKQPLVLNADRLAEDPERIVSAFCSQFGLPFSNDQLQWSAHNSRDWSQTQHWHKTVSQTTGFCSAKGHYQNTVENNQTLREFYEYHTPFYKALEEACLQ
ncbi:hypothetical protein [Marinobacter sp. AC-23]|uniref:sulfotransferase-like domain-containing protein n=1 Tax=Marinobacter sp. AC-23 TaxID=1879031 RepID=UPI0009F6095D|nr:hypothetical protein [Marinobacter sp. AC-23]